MTTVRELLARLGTASLDERDKGIAVIFDAAGAELSEPRPGWPSGQLAWFEVARLGLRELPA